MHSAGHDSGDLHAPCRHSWQSRLGTEAPLRPLRLHCVRSSTWRKALAHTSRIRACPGQDAEHVLSAVLERILAGIAAAGNDDKVHAASRALGQEVHHLRKRLLLARLVALRQADRIVERVAAKPARMASPSWPPPTHHMCCLQGHRPHSHSRKWSPKSEHNLASANPSLTGSNSLVELVGITDKIAEALALTPRATHCAGAATCWPSVRSSSLCKACVRACVSRHSGRTCRSMHSAHEPRPHAPGRRAPSSG